MTCKGNDIISYVIDIDIDIEELETKFSWNILVSTLEGWIRDSSILQTCCIVRSRFGDIYVNWNCFYFNIAK